MNHSAHTHDAEADTDAGGMDTLIEDTANRLFAEQVDKGLRTRAEAGELDAALWRQVTEGGYPLLLATEAAGGFAQPWRVAYPLLRGLGYWQVPLPLAETMLAAQLASLAGMPVPEGPLTVIEQGCGNQLTLDGSAAAPTLSGTAHAVPWARHAVAALVSLADGRLGWLALKPNAPVEATVQIQERSNLAGLPSDSLVLKDAPLTQLSPSPLPLAQPVWTLGAIARSAMLVGALESTLEQAVRYAGERVQFGKPIGKNQAIQQNLALMAGDVAAARVAALVAAADAPSAQDAQTAMSAQHASCAATRFSAAVAKVRASEAATRGTSIAHQVHGAIGFTHEHALHFATRRLWAWREEFGTDAHWAAELGRAAIRARAAGFWPGLTAKQFQPAA